MNEKPLLLIIDDEIEILNVLQQSLEDENFRVQTLSDGNKATEMIGKLIPDLILLDIFMPNCNGLKLLSQIKKEYPQQRVMIISGFGNISIAIEAIKKGALDFIEKPLNLDEILPKIEFLKNEYKIHNHEIERPNKENKTKKLRDKLEIVGQSFLFSELMHQVDRIARLNFPIIIYGQHGTGKSLIAKYIHLISNLSTKAIKTLDCSFSDESISKKLKVLFNKEEKTIYIKNINELGTNNQKLLFEYLENNKKMRIIASTTESLFKLCYDNKFNKNLYYRLNITPIEIPPLNKRRYDIPLLLNHFINKENLKHNKKIVFNNRSIRILRNHNWTENVRGLKKLVQKIILTIKQDHQVITPDFLFNYIKEREYKIIEEQSFLKFNSLSEAINEFEKNFLAYHLHKNNYDINQLCDQLQLTSDQLKAKMLKLNL